MEWLPEFGDRQHQPHQVHLPGDRQSLVNLLQVPVDGAFREPRPRAMSRTFLPSANETAT